MERLAHDVRIAWRGFRRTPTFPVAVLVVLAISIGSAVAMFTTARAVLLQRLPVLQPTQLAVLTSYEIPGTEKSPPATTLRELRHQLTTVSDIAGVGHWGLMRSPYVDGTTTRILGHADVTANYFSVLGVRAHLGRLFAEVDEGFGAAPPMVLSYSAWQSKFAGDSGVIGRQIMYPYTRSAYTIIGVAPAGLDYPLGVECWTPMSRTDPRQTLAIVRLKPGATLLRAQAEYFREASRLQPSFRLTGASGQLFMDVVVGEVRPALVLLSGSVFLLLLIACVNVANLFLVRAGRRAHELTLRRVLGASYAGVVRQLIVESSLLAVAGGALGVGLAYLLIRALQLAAPQQLPRLDVVRIDSGMLVVALGTTVLSVLIFGLAPALVAAGASHEKHLRSASRSMTASRFRVRVRDGLVASQVALALTLLLAAGLLSRSLLLLQNATLGFVAPQLSLASFAWDATKTDTPTEILAMGQQMEQRLREMPGIQSVSPLVIPPFYGTNVWHGSIESETDVRNNAKRPMDVPIEIGGASYFETMKIPITQGRGFLESDNKSSEGVVVVSASIARHFWPNSNPVGNRIRFVSEDAKAEPWSRVIGVVTDTRYRSLRSTSPMLYNSWRQMDGWQGTFAIRSSRNPALLASDISDVARAVDPTLVLGDLRSMNDALGVPLSTPRLMALLLSVFGGIAVLLAAVGLYGVLASGVREQTREIGIRAALGAAPARLVLAVVGHALVVAGAGATVGLVVSFGVMRLMQSMLFQTSPTDLPTILGVSATLFAVTILSAAAPALYAARVHPMIALRSE